MPKPVKAVYAIGLGPPWWRKLWRSPAAAILEAFSRLAMGPDSRERVYHVTWRRCGAEDFFEQDVPANSEGEALRQAEQTVRAALGDNAKVWIIHSLSFAGPTDAPGDD